MLIALIVAAIILGYGGMAGLTFHLAFKHTDHSEDASIADGIFWPIMFAPILIRVFAHVYLPRMLEAQKRRRLEAQERKALPAVQIKPGAKLDSMADYQKLKQLLTEFEIENGFDRLLEE